MFTLPFGVLLSTLLLGAGGAIFGAIGGRIDRLAADGAALSRSFPHHVGQQLMVGGKYRVSEPVAQQRVGNTLYADARLSIIQREAVAVIVITAELPNELLGAAELLVIHTRFQGLSCSPPPQASFSGKIPEPRARMIFPRNRKARPCRWKRAGCDLCPANRDGFIISFSCRSRFWGTRVSG